MLEFIENNYGAICTILGLVATMSGAAVTIWFRLDQKIQREKSDKVRLTEQLTELKVKVEINSEKMLTLEKRISESEHTITSATTLLNSMKDEFRKDFEDVKNSIREIQRNFLQLFQDKK